MCVPSTTRRLRPGQHSARLPARSASCCSSKVLRNGTAWSSRYLTAGSLNRAKPCIAAQAAVWFSDRPPGPRAMAKRNSAVPSPTSRRRFSAPLQTASVSRSRSGGRRSSTSCHGSEVIERVCIFAQIRPNSAKSSAILTPMRTLPGVCYAEGMTRYLRANGIRIFDYPQFAMEQRDRVRDCAASLAFESGVTIEHIAKSHIRKEDVVARVLEQRGDHPGLVHIISAMEACDAYQPWHDKPTHKTYLRPDSGKCLHDYFYFMDALFGLIDLRCRRGVRSGCNSTATATTGWPANWPPRVIGYSMADNAFVRIDDWPRAQALADSLS